MSSGSWIECSPAIARIVVSCSRLWSSRRGVGEPVAVDVGRVPQLYGGTSGGTIPSIRSMRKNGVPSTSPVGSKSPTFGTGTSVRSPTIRIASYWSWSA